jgi:hypothetical protein
LPPLFCCLFFFFHFTTRPAKDLPERFANSQNEADPGEGMRRRRRRRRIK